MKIRNGFVSNSSSSSFVIFGVSVDSKKLTEYEVETVETINGIKCIDLDNGSVIVGVGSDVDSTDGNIFKAIDFNNFTKPLLELKEYLGKLGLWDEKKFGRYIGNFPC